MRKRQLANLAGHIGALRCPVPKGRPEPVRYRIDPQLPNEPGDRTTVDRAGALRRKDQVRAVCQVTRLAKYLQRSRRQRNTMLALRLHPLRRYRPRRRCEIDLVPGRETNLAGPARRQHQKLEGEHRRTVRIRCPHPGERGPDLPEGQGALMLAHAATLGQRGGDSVAGWVVASMALRHGPLHHRPDALAHAAHGLGLGMPVRNEHRHHVWGGDLVNALAAEPRHGVVPEARPPLHLALAAILPALAMDGDHGLGRLREGWYLRPAPEGLRITSGPRDLAVLEGGLPGFGKGDVGEAAEADISAVSIHGSAPDPLLGDRRPFSGFVDSQPQAVLIAASARSPIIPDCPSERAA